MNMATQFSEETMKSISESFKESHNGYWLVTMYNENGCACEICYAVDPCFYETLSEGHFYTIEEFVRWLSEKSALCTNERLLRAYERQLNSIETGKTAHDFNGNVYEKQLRTDWLREHIAEMKGSEG